ncbi:hypothetical protein AWC38_SpisGene13533 [Stylophora pistillata]|uniref:CxC3 like cysteine cluster domain-containing protein n=1 Tax=Stylophora pistillata TaxID=50429 RepID=A0A2B4RXT9_STYPI|nr:hypothetical protein AWC38_SpisGene13533 [Stylophora pistillata]
MRDDPLISVTALYCEAGRISYHSLVIDLDQLIEECATYTKPSTIQKGWTTRIEDLGKSWANKRPQIMMSLLELEPLLPSVPCIHCKKDQPLVHCRQRGLKEIMCAKCDNDVYRRNHFHDREIYHEGFFKCVAPSVSLDREGNLTTVGVINDSAFSIAFKEWKFCNHEINLLQFKDFMVCPACATYQHSAHVDGNAKLYRYKSAGEKFSSEDGAAIQKSFELYQKIEYMASSINQRLKNINRLADCKVEIADALDNNFLWALHDQTGEMPLRAKKQVVEKYLEGRRLTEEKVLLEKEMTGFLKFYKDTVIPEILSTIESLKAVLSECNEDCSLDEASGPVSSSEGSSQGHLQPHFKSKAWQPSTEL